MGFLDVAGTPWEDLAVDERVIHMGHNCNQLPIHDAIHEAMINEIRQDHYRNYSPPYGFESLREQIANDVPVAGTSVMVTQGATEAIFQAMSAVLAPGDQTIASDPAWPHIANFARSLGSQVVSIPIYSPDTGYKLLPEVVREHVTPSTKLITIIDPLNPIGSGYTEAEIKELCAIAEENDAYLLHDATYRDFSLDSHFPAIRYSERAMMNVSLSKICGFAGLRVGATIANPREVERIMGKQVSRLGGSWVSQKGAIAAYETKPEWLPPVLEANRENQNKILEAIGKTTTLEPLVVPSHGNFLAVDTTATGRGAEDFVEAMLANGIVLRSGHYTSETFGDRFVRITTTVPAAHADRFCAALPRALDDLQSRS